MAGGQTGAVRLSGGEPACELLVERERESAVVAETVAEAGQGRSVLAVIEGPAGIGKTRLLAENRQAEVQATARRSCVGPPSGFGLPCIALCDHRR